jgi:hypothetical protein
MNGIGHEVDWIQLVEEAVQWQPFVNMIRDLWVSSELDSRVTVRFCFMEFVTQQEIGVSVCFVYCVIASIKVGTYS